MAEAAIESVSKSAENFTTDFHKSVAGKEQGNFVSSGLSAHTVLAMTAYGARGSTAQAFRKTLHLPEDDSHAHQGFQGFVDALNNVPDVILKVANKIYAATTINVKDRFKEITGTYFRSESETINFEENVKAVKVINNWCVEKTNGKINDLVTPNDIDSNTRMVLLNAVYFKGNWKNKFNEKNTEPKPFHVDAKTTINVPTMFKKAKFYYTELEEFNADVVALPYVNEDLYMVIIVPKEIGGLEKLEKNLDKVQLETEHFKHHKQEINLSLPKFKVESTIDLNDHLSEMGLSEIFTDKADFGEIADESLKVSKVRQKAFIEVNEEGSEAAAVTGMMIMMCSMPMPPMSVHVDKPFHYKIVYKNTTLFSGRIVNPL